MAMGSDSLPNRSVSEKIERVKSSVKKENKLQGNGVDASPAKRTGKPDIRVIGRRIYDPVNGKTCHQCRHQKTMDIVAACTILKNNKICTIMYCHKCLLNRYGEKADEVSALEEWTCPKCRGICNCSICMKRKGHQPTGMLINTAKKTGFSSVSEMLLKGSEHAGSPKRQDVVITSPGKRDNENSFDGELDANMLNHANKKVKKVEEDNNIMSQSSDNKKLSQKGLEAVHEKMTKKTKRDMLDETKPEKNDEETNKQTNNVLDDEKKPKKSRKGDLINVDSKKNDVTLARRTSPRKLNVHNNNDSVITEKCSVKPSENGKSEDGNGFTANDMSTRKHQIPDSHVKILLPTGIEMDSVAGIDVSTKDVGNVLQFLEFCAVFGKILEVKKGQPEQVLRDILHGRIGRRGKFSLTVQFHINLLSILLSEQGEEYANLSPAHGKGSWFSALKKCLSESQSVLKAQGLDSLVKAADYETLEASEKLRLLNILCDEVLETEKVRNWMDDQNVKHAEKVKEDRHKVTAAKDQEKSLKQKMKDDIAKAIIAKHGAPLSISEHEAIVSNIKRKASQAHAKVLESKGILLKNNQHADTVRIEPIFMGVGGHVYWKLNCLGKSDVLHQAASGDSLTFDDKWFIIDDEGKEVIDKRISSSRENRPTSPRPLDNSIPK
ncbi:hypothetical protein CASFOL_018265 [Castilleja foliolosa]|uniref:DDT domain-containing protein n=1 Tax=Castilleja foliolosa TaxID=1961234 RepID=A0ABD3DAN4_9LAMI